MICIDEAFDEFQPILYYHKIRENVLEVFEKKKLELQAALPANIPNNKIFKTFMMKDYSSIYFLKNNIWSATLHAENQLDSVRTIDRLIKMDQQLFSLTLRKKVSVFKYLSNTN